MPVGMLLDRPPPFTSGYVKEEKDKIESRPKRVKSQCARPSLRIRIPSITMKGIEVLTLGAVGVCKHKTSTCTYY